MKLRYLDIQGFMSFDNTPHRLPLGDVTVLLGANGSGKSNVLSIFEMLQSLAIRYLRFFVGKYGADKLLYYGSKRTSAISLQLCFDDGGDNQYKATVHHANPDALFVADEEMLFCQKAIKKQNAAPRTRHSLADDTQFLTEKYFLPPGIHGESGLAQDMALPSAGSLIREYLLNIGCFQFLDTSGNSRIRSRVYMDDSQNLHVDGANLAAFLKMLRDHKDWNRYYERIVRHIQSILPQFKDFDLTTLPQEDNCVRLNWRDNSGNDYLFDPHQLSNATVRFMALATLLLQPPRFLPSLIVLDEPELGLHPDAISELAGMIRMASQHAQILLATQSTRLLDEFDPEQIVIVEWNKLSQSTILRQLDPEELRDWLDHYSLSQLWEKNVLGGQP